MAINQRVAVVAPQMTEWRRFLHTCPETAFEERRTSEYVADILTSFGLEVHRGLAGTGVVGVLARGEGKKIAFRADLDALHIQEENTFSHKSQNEGRMHACGHDGHTAMLLGAAKCLSEDSSLAGTVYFIFQPGEENGGGAPAMMKDGLFERFPAEKVFGLHNFPGMPAATFAICPGPMMAACDLFEITISGAGAHAGMPHLGQDTILAASNLVIMLQSIVSRNVGAMDAAVLSITQFSGGTTWNVLPETVTLRGTVRTYSKLVQDLVESRLKEITSGVAASFGVTARVKYDRRYPATVNHPAETETAARAAAAVVGPEKVSTDMTPVMGSEDFSFFLQEKPGAYIAMGTGGTAMLHQPLYDFNDEMLVVGASYWVTLAENLLKQV